MIHCGGQYHQGGRKGREVSKDDTDDITVPLKRMQELEEDLQAFKRSKISVNAAAEELKCSFTNELLVNPVTAEDGSVSEEQDISEWIQKKGNQVTPPPDE